MQIAFPATLCAQIGLPDAARRCAYEAFYTRNAEIERILSDPERRFVPVCMRALRRDRGAGAAFSLAAALAVVDVHTRRLYAEKGLPQQVFVNTMRDISVWVHDAAWAYRVTGLCNVPWIAHVLFLEIFWIGRLEFEFSKTNFAAARLPFAARKTVPIADKAPVLNVHIPADGKLLPKAAEDAFSAAERFFATYFPQYKYAGFVCDSWLLDENNRRFMRPDSNILRFADAFDHVVQTRHSNHELLRRLWGVKHVSRQKLRTLPEETSLQAAAKAYLCARGRSFNGYGMRLRRETEQSPV